MEYRTRADGAVCMSLEVFQALDFGKVCAQLGLRPSEPYTRANGSKTEPPKRRRRRRGGRS